MTITYTILGIPLIDQLTEGTADGQPNENARNNCVFDVCAALATARSGKHYYGDQIKDMDNNYGQGYTGKSSVANLVDTMLTLGVSLTRVAHPTQQLLIDELHHHISQGHACIITMPSDWNSALTDPQYQPWNPRTYQGPSHVGLACGVGSGEIRVMNPWGGFWHDGSDSYWAARLLEGEIWVAIFVAPQQGTASSTTPQSTGTHTMTIPSGWKDNGATLIAPNGVPVVRGFRSFVLSHPWDANNWPLKVEYSTSQIEPGNAAMGKGARQDFRMTSLGCQQHADGSWGSPYVIYTGQDILALETQLAAANAHIQQLEAAPQTTPANPRAATALALILSLKETLAQIQAL